MSIAAADSVFGAERADADGAVGLQPVVPLVRGAGHGRADLESRGIQQESRPLAQSGARTYVFRSRAEASAGALIGRPLHRGWHDDRGVCEPEELSKERRRRR
jgi:hypothetical protein